MFSLASNLDFSSTFNFSIFVTALLRASSFTDNFMLTSVHSASITLICICFKAFSNSCLISSFRDLDFAISCFYFSLWICFCFAGTSVLCFNSHVLLTLNQHSAPYLQDFLCLCWHLLFEHFWSGQSTFACTLKHLFLYSQNPIL